MSAGAPIRIRFPSERVWRFEPSPGSRAVWKNDMLVEMIYRYVRRLEGPRAVVNGMILCKSRFWLMARILFRDCHFDDVAQTFWKECSLERFTGYLNSVRTLRLRDDELEPSENFSAKKVATRRRDQMPNLKEIRPARSWTNPSTLERTIDLDGQQVVVEHFIHQVPLESLAQANVPVESSNVQAEGILSSIKILSYSDYEVEKAQLRSVLSLMMNWRPPTGIDMSSTHPFAYLHTLELPLSSADKMLSDIDVEELGCILSTCPQLSRLACRIQASLATESTLDQIFSKGKHLESVSLHTDGFLVPHLSALSRFEEVTLVCPPLLRNSDLESLDDYVKPDRPFIPRLRRFTYGFNGAISDTLCMEDGLCAKPYSVAQSIRKLLPRNCIFAASGNYCPLRYGFKESELKWWTEFTDIMDIMMKEIDPPRPAILPLPLEA